MHLVANLSMLGPKPTGLGVYATRCAQALAERTELRVIEGSVPIPGTIPIARAPTAISLGHSWRAPLNRMLWLRSLRLAPDDLVYTPTHHALPHVHGQIFTIHDLICLRYPLQHWKQYVFFRFAVPRLLRQCRAVFTVSETTRNDISNVYGYPKERILVVPNGVDTTAFTPLPQPSTNPTDPFLLIVGATFPHKNVSEVLRVAHLWRSKYRLVVSSPRPRYRLALIREATEAGLMDRVTFREYVSQAELIELYRTCTALIYPSTWEGFGIPPLEAFACGKPVIASDIPVHREILANAPYYVRLGDVESWQHAFRDLRSEQQWDQKRSDVQSLVTKYSWQNTAHCLMNNLLQVEPRIGDMRASRY
jgi:glycosyltransferase involved in cell wall biosynthesis